jgi:hypothetical protein
MSSVGLNENYKLAPCSSCLLRMSKPHVLELLSSASHSPSSSKVLKTLTHKTHSHSLHKINGVIFQGPSYINFFDFVNWDKFFFVAIFT